MADTERVHGPYQHRGRWRLVLVGPGGDRATHSFATEEEARKAARSLRRQIDRTSGPTVGEAIEKYEHHLKTEKGNKSTAWTTTVYRLGVFFPDRDDPIGALTSARGKALFEALTTRTNRHGKPYSVDFRLNALAEAKTFLGWCRDRGFVVTNPLEGVKGVGKRRHGKAKLRIDEARRWLAVADDLARGGDTSAVAAMASLLMGLRASEIVGRKVRDLDAGGTVLWIEATKTEAGTRRVRVPAALQPHLRGLAAGKKPEAPLFGQHWRDWVRKAVARICRLGKVPEVSAHGMRGLHAELALEAGQTGHAVAAALGHESATTTVQSYAGPAALAAGQQRKVEETLLGN